MNLRISGPTPLPPRVRAALSTDMISHRSTAFRDIVAEVLAGLTPVFGDPATILPFTCSGTGGLEAAVVNTVRPGQRVVVVSIGYFGTRMAEIARMAGLDIEVIEVPWGQAADPGELQAVLRRLRDVAAVLVTHNETSTGVLNPLPELCRVVRESSDALLIVDVVSSVGATPVRMRDWGIDVAVGVSQKALMSPPGLALLGVSSRALTAAAANPARRYYFDFTAMARAVEENTTTYTPAIPVFHALQTALRMISVEGWDRVLARHQRLSEQCRSGLADLGLAFAADQPYASPTVTSFFVPADMRASDVRERMAVEHKVQVASGRAKWKDSVLRIGHMGYVNENDVAHVLAALGAVLDRAGGSS
ncbi:aminotransferase class V-fold PLP-dependent enzyme [Kibdelosporangium aridum]|uniref:Tritium exchange subunit n=2 Tax=Pseudonocardiaceae TaxID=2070 RepID=A0A428YQQ8_KIBAR|nr:alanine--glyoxylate aminotransferase family protein [Kibdelosporangium aridum]RSM70813.1 aminotransferase class V-fold PLP-dependent enzyme [Kibdelosporangium aridum]CAB45025.1 putative aminotransferase [Amycolatopsis orientalis]